MFERRFYLGSILLLLLVAVVSSGRAATCPNINVTDGPTHRIRYTSGRTIYEESLETGRWVGLYHASDGRISFPPGGYNFSYVPGAESAFLVNIRKDPKDSRDVSLEERWEWVGAHGETPPKNGDCQFVVELRNTLQPIYLKLYTLLDSSPVMTRWIEITNTSSQPVALTKVYPWAGRLWRGSSEFSLGYQTRSDATYEGWLDWKRLSDGTTVIEGDKGHEGHDDPFFILHNEGTGDYFIGDLAWSANWQMEFHANHDLSSNQVGLSFGIGPAASSPQRVLAPGESVQTPAVHLGEIAGSFDAAVQAMHQHIRRSIVLPDKSHLIEYDVPCDQGYYPAAECNAANLLKSIDVAKEIGAEVFILDAGWWDVYGEWSPSRERFPEGLKPVVQYAHSKGLLFGLYAEVEGGRGNWGASNMAKKHPDWLEPQNVLDLTNPDVAKYVADELEGIIDEYHPDLYREDFIPGFTYQGPATLRSGFQENNYWRHYQTLYRILDDLHRRHPDLILQWCTNGGAREDLGMLGHIHETYTNEGDLTRILRSYAGKTVSLPPEILTFGTGIEPDRGSLDTQLRSEFTLSTPFLLGGAAPSVQALTDFRRNRYLHYADLYKSFIRPLLPTVNVFHHEPVDSHQGVEAQPWFVMEFDAPDQTKGWATLVRLGSTDSDVYLFRPKGLSPGKVYKVTFDSDNSSVIATGLSLIREGIPVRLEDTLSSELLLFEAQP